MSLERHERLKVVVSGLLIGGLAMAIAPRATQGDVVPGHPSRSLALPDLQLQNYLFEDNSIESLEQSPGMPPPKTGNEIVGGVLGGALLGGAGLAAGWGIGSIFSDETDTEWGTVPVFMGMGIGSGVGYLLGSAIGVYSVGNTDTETGSFLAALGGSIVGGAAGLAAGGLVVKGLNDPQSSVAFVLTSILGPPVGATIGFNATRRYKPPPPSKNGFINFKGGGMYVGTPTIYLQPDPLDRKVLTQNVDLLKATF